MDRIPGIRFLFFLLYEFWHILHTISNILMSVWVTVWQTVTCATFLSNHSGNGLETWLKIWLFCATISFFLYISYNYWALFYGLMMPSDGMVSCHSETNVWSWANWKYFWNKEAAKTRFRLPPSGRIIGFSKEIDWESESDFYPGKKTA